MTQAPSNIRPLNAQPVPRMGITGTLGTPGLAVVPPVSRGAQLADDLLKTLGVAGYAAGEFGDQMRRDAAMKAREVEQLRKAAEDSADLFRGQAKSAAQTDLIKFRARHDAGEFIGEGGLSPEDQVEEWIASTSEGMPQAWGESYRESLAAPLLALLYSNQNATRETVRAQLIGDYANVAKVADDGAELRAIYDKARTISPQFTEDDVLGRVVLPAAVSAAESGDEKRFAAAAEVLGTTFDEAGQVNGGKFIAEMRRAAATLRTAQRERINKAATESEQAVFALANAGTPIDLVIKSIDDDPDFSPERRDQLRRFFVDRGQDATIDTLRRDILNGTVTPDEVGQRVRAGANLKRTDPGFIDPAIGGELVRASERAVKHDASRDQALYVFSGGHAVLTDSQHSGAVAELLGPGPNGLAFINDANRIAKPVELATAVLRGGVLPNSTAETLIRNLSDGTDAEVYNASLAVGMIGASDPRLYAKLVDAAGDHADLQIGEAVEAFKSGRIRPVQDGESIVPGAAPAVRRVRDAQNAVQDVPAVRPEVMKELQAADVNLGGLATGIIKSVGERAGHVVDTRFGLDFLNPDPSIGTADQNVLRWVEGWFADRYTRLRTALPGVLAQEEARRYAAGKVRESVDFVRWGDDVQPVLIDHGRGMKLPDDLRWSVGFEDEAAGDLEKAGFVRDDVVTMRPYVSPSVRAGEDPAESMGWTYITRDGDPVVDDSGNLLVFRPSDRARRKAAEVEAIARRKARELSAPAARAYLNLNTIAGQVKGKYAPGVVFPSFRQPTDAPTAPAPE